MIFFVFFFFFFAVRQSIFIRFLDFRLYILRWDNKRKLIR